MQDEHILLIIEKYLAGNATVEEVIQLNAWYDAFDDKPALTPSFSLDEKKAMGEKMFSAILAGIEVCPGVNDEKGVDSNPDSVHLRSGNTL